MINENIPIGKVYNLEEVFSDPQVKHRHMLEEIELPGGGKERTVGISIKLSDTPGKIRKPVPTPGEHTKEILSGMGYTEEELRKLL